MSIDGGCAIRLVTAINYKNLDYEIETSKSHGDPYSIRQLAINYKNLDYEIETSMVRGLSHCDDVSATINYKNLDYEIETKFMSLGLEILLFLTINYKNLDYEIETFRNPLF